MFSSPSSRGGGTRMRDGEVYLNFNDELVDGNA